MLDNQESTRWRALALACMLPLLFSTVCLSATVTQSYGPFDVVFHNTGDSNGRWTGEQDWTSDQMADVGTAIDVWASRINDVPGRRITMHAVWEELDSWTAREFWAARRARSMGTEPRPGPIRSISGETASTTTGRGTVGTLCWSST